MGKYASLDEQTIGCEGKHPDIIRITFKKEVGRFQCDALGTDDYTYSFYFRIQPASTKYLDQSLSPLHARCMVLLDQLENKHLHISINNHHISGMFVRYAF